MFEAAGFFSEHEGQFDSTQPAYYSTIQFLPEPLDSFGYGIIGRQSDGIYLCSWQRGEDSWSCTRVTTDFNDDHITVDNGQSWPNNLADY